MKVLTTNPTAFITGDVFSPSDLNAAMNYAAAAVADVASKRFQHSFLPIPFVEDMATGYTQASSTEERTQRFICHKTCFVDRVFLSANLVSSAEVTVDITLAAGGVPAGSVSPWLSTKGATLTSLSGAATTSTTGIIASANDDVTDLQIERVLLVAGTEYLITVATTGTFTISRFDVILHLVVDRWTLAGTTDVPSFQPVQYTDSITDDQNVVNGNVALLDAKAGAFLGASGACTPALFLLHNLVGGGAPTAANLRTLTLPRFDSARAQSKLVRVYLFVAMDAAVTTTITLQVIDELSNVLATITAALVAQAQKTVDSGVLAISMTAATPAISSTVAKDYQLIFSSNNANNARKVAALLWFSRA